MAQSNGYFLQVVSWCKNVLPSLKRDYWDVPDFETDHDYKEAVDWLNGLQLDKSNSFDFVLEYAWKKYNEAALTLTALETKANNLIRNSGIIAAFASVAISYPKGAPEIAILVPVFLLVGAAFFATRASDPIATAKSASIQDVVDDAIKGTNLKAYVAAALHCAVKGKYVAINWKSRLIKLSYALFYLGLIGFLCCAVTAFV